jgi:hypothetical protein
VIIYTTNPKIVREFVYPHAGNAALYAVQTRMIEKRVDFRVQFVGPYVSKWGTQTDLIHMSMLIERNRADYWFGKIERALADYPIEAKILAKLKAEYQEQNS